MALKLKTGIEQLTTPDKSGGKYTPFISWKDGDRKFLAFVTPADEIPKVMIHNFVKVPTGDDEKPFRWGTYFCRKDPAWQDESNGKCFLCDEVQHSPLVRYVAIAVELEPQFDGKKVTGLSVKYNEKDGKEYPQVGLVMQSKKLFFAYLGAYNETRADITKVSFDILRQGKAGDDTKYLFFDIQDRPDLSDIEQFIPDLGDTLENMGSVEAYEGLKDVKAADQEQFGVKKVEAKTATPEPRSEEEFDKLSRELGLSTAS